jgi:energy-coupling factor transporter ATP-binding protein EcfA2
MKDDQLDKDDKYKPISFSRNYFDEPVKVQPYWIKEVAATNFLSFGDFTMDVLGKPAITGPNGYGKTILIKLIKAVLEIATSRTTGTLMLLTKRVTYHEYGDNFVEYFHLFDTFTVRTVDGHEYGLVCEDYNNGSYNFVTNDNVYPIHDGVMEVVPTAPCMSTVTLLPTGRLSSPDVFIYQFARDLNGEINYGFIDMWYNYVIQGKELNADPSEYVFSFSKHKIPYSDTEAVKQVCKNIGKWISSCFLSHGSVEMLLQLMAMSSKSRIVLIDDAEIGLHPSAQVSYMFLMATLYQCGIQVLFTTHSPSMFDLNFSYSNDMFSLFEQKE